MKKTLVYGLAALTVAAGVGFGGFSIYKANAQENAKESTSASAEQSSESQDIEFQLTDEEYEKIENGEEITLNGMAITGLAEGAEGIEYGNGAALDEEVELDSSIIDESSEETNEESIEVQLDDEQYAKIKNGEEITLNGMTITGLSKDAANFAGEDMVLGDMDSVSEQ